MNAIFSSNLGDLLDDVNATALRSIRVDQIDPDPDQPRKEFNEASVLEMGESLATDGQLQAIAVIAKEDGRYRLVYGERRWRGARAKGLRTLDSKVYPSGTDSKLIRRYRLIENIQREDMSALDTARAIATIVADEGSQTAAAKVLKKSEGQISKYLSVLNLSPIAAELAGTKVTRDVETLSTVAKIERADPAAARQLVNEAQTTGRLTRERARQTAQEVAVQVNERLKIKTATRDMAAPVKAGGADSSAEVLASGRTSRPPAEGAPSPVRVREGETVMVGVRVIDGSREARRFAKAQTEHGEAQLYRGGVAREPERCWILFGDSPRPKQTDREPRLQEFPCAAIALSGVVKSRA